MLYWKQVTCAVCGTESQQGGIASTSSFGPPNLDLREDFVRRGVMNAWIQECPGCRFVANDLSNATAAEAEVRHETGFAEAGRIEGMPELAVRFIRRAYVEERAGQLSTAMRRLLNAAWVLDDFELDASAIRMRAANLVVSLGAAADIGQQLQRLDLLRRAGALTEVVNVADEMLSGELHPDHRKIIATQRRLAVEKRTEAVSLKEVWDSEG